MGFNSGFKGLNWRLAVKIAWISNWLTNESSNCLSILMLKVVMVYIRIFPFSYSTTNEMHLLSQMICSCKTLYMFRTVFLSIIRSSKLCIQQQYMSNSCCYLLLSGMRWNCHIPIVQPTRCTCYLKLFILVKRSTYFRRSFRPSSGAQNCVYSSCLTYTVAVYAVLSSWWWAGKRPKHVEL